MALTLVGDVDQMLYRFAGAKPEILTEEIDKLIPEIETVKLRINYRSTPQVIENSQSLIANNYTGNNGPYDQRMFKEIIAKDNASNGESLSFTMFDAPDEESENLSQSLLEMLGNGNEPQDFFVGARTKAQLGYLEGDLVKAKIPFINIAGGSFWGSKHVQDVIAYAKLAYDNSNKLAFKRIYNISSVHFQQPFNTRSKDIKKGDYNSHRWLAGKGLFLQACNEDYSQIHLAYNNRNAWRWKPGIADLEDLLNAINYALAENGIGLALEVVINECYKKWLETEEGIVADDEGNNKLDDLKTVIEIAKSFESDTQGFFDYVDECIEAAENAKNGDWSKYVVLSTIHRLKGLERKIVFGVGLSEGDECGLLPHTFSKINPPQFGILPTSGKGRIEDERCLTYVLISRAMEKVYLSGVRQYRNNPMTVSRFVEEIGNGSE